MTLATVSAHCVPLGAHLPLTSCLADLCLQERERERDREREREREREKEGIKKKVLSPYDLSPGPEQGVGLSPPRHMRLHCMVLSSSVIPTLWLQS